MEFEDIANLVNQVAIERKGRPLKDVERLVLEGAWHNQTYGAMATQAGGYTEDYLKKDVGPKLWRLLSDLIDHGDIRVTKRNIQNVLKHWAAQQESTKQPVANDALAQTPGSTVDKTHEVQPDRETQDDALEVWASPRLDVSDFIGRREELAQLQRWQRSEDCRAVLLWGLTGVGKTTLAAKLFASQPADAAPMGYLSLRDGTTDEDFFSALVDWLRSADPTSAAPGGEPSSWIMRQFTQRRYILVVDQLETLFCPEQPAGTFRPEVQKVRSLFQQVAEQLHQSHVVWVSREKPLELGQMRGDQMREFRLGELPLGSVQHLLHERGLKGGDQVYQSLFGYYGGSPLLLKGLATTVEEVYRGRVKAFLTASDPVIPHRFRAGIIQVIQRLTESERNILCWLALAHGPVSLETLKAKMVDPPAAMTIQSLISRGLCRPAEDHRGEATVLELPTTVRLITLDWLRPQLLHELLDNRFDRLNRLPLVTVTNQESIQQQQRQAMVVPLAQELRRRYPTEAELTGKCQQLHQSLGEHTSIGGYGAGNFIHLCECLGVSLSGGNFAHQSIRQSDLRQVNLQGTNFSHARFADTVFATALGRNPVMAFSRDGRYLATGDQEGRLLLWNMDQGKLARVLEHGPDQGICALAFSPEADYLAIGTDGGSLWLWSVSSAGSPPEILLEGSEALLTLAFSPDGRCLVSGDALGRVHYWEIDSGERHGPWQYHQGAVHNLTFDHQGQTLLSSGSDQRACLWRIFAPTPAREFQAGPTMQLRSVGFIADPQWPQRSPRAVAAGYDEQSLTLWNVETGHSYWSVPNRGQGILALALDVQGQHLVCSYQDFSVAVWNLPRHQMCYRLPPFSTPVWSLAFSPSGKEFVTARDYAIELWDGAQGVCRRSFLSQAHPVRCLTFVRAGNTLLTGHGDHTLRLWQLSETDGFTACPNQLVGHTAPVRALAASAKGDWFASSAEDQTIRIWHGASRTCNRVIASLPSMAHLLAFNPEETWLASAGEDASITLWDVASGTRSQVLERNDSPASCLMFSPDGRWLASGSRDGDLHLWDLHQGHHRQIVSGHLGQIHSLSWGPTETLLVSASYDGTVRWWDLAEDKPLGRWQHSHGHWLQAVSQGPKGELLAITSQDGTIEVWAIENDRRLHQLKGHSQDIWQVVTSPDKTTLATASQDDEIRVWHLATGGCLQVLHPNLPYEGANIWGAEGLSEPEETMLKALGAVVRHG